MELATTCALEDGGKGIGAGWEAGSGEAGLVAALRAGRDEAYAELVRRHGERLLEVTRRFLADDEDARDAVQETFLAAFRAIDRFEGTAALGTWLHRIAVNAALMILRRKRSRPELRVEDDELGPLADAGRLRGLPSWSVEEAGADVAAETRELRAFVRAAVARLPASHREVILLRDLGGLDSAEAGARLGLSANAVKLRAYRARLALRELLAGTQVS